MESQNDKEVMPIQELIIKELKKQHIEFIYFVDISHLPGHQNRNLPHAVLFGVKCSPEYLKRVSDNPNYVQEMIERNYFEDDEHYMHEMEMYRVSDILASFIENNGYDAYSLSDANQAATTDFDGMFAKTLLPLKTIAMYAGLGWIGKNSLLVNKHVGCSQSFGGVLTNAPLEVTLETPLLGNCGTCSICVNICQPNALKGTNWKKGIEREDIIDVSKCTTCLKCMVHCPYTQRYMRKNL